MIIATGSQKFAYTVKKPPLVIAQNPHAAAWTIFNSETLGPNAG